MMVAEVTAFLAQRTKQRNSDTMKYLEVRAKMKPPPPMTMEELEQHPLSKQKAQKRSKQDRDFDTGGEDEEKETLPFIVKPTQDRDVMQRLHQEIRSVNHELHASMKSRPTTSPRLSPRPPTVGTVTSRGKVRMWDEAVDWEGTATHGRNEMPAPPVNLDDDDEIADTRTEAVVPLQSSSSAAFLTSVDDDTTLTKAVVLSNTANSASPLSVRSLGPEHDKQILSRDPNELRKIRNEDRHAQYYRGNTVEQPLPAKINPDVATTSDMELFQQKLVLRDHYFNDASIREIERARAAQDIFRPVKIETIQRFLEDDRYRFCTAGHVLGKSRQATHSSARAKDNAERLDVFFDHLDRLERYTRPSFPDYAIENLEQCIALTRKVVTQKEGMQEHNEFDYVVEQSFPPEMLVHYYVADFLKMLAAIFGIGSDKFRTWLREALKRFEARDYEPVFRSVEMAIGKEVTKESRFKIHVNMVRGALPAVVRTEMSLRICVERHSSETTRMPGGAKVTWNEWFSFHVYNEQSPITMFLVQDSEVIGQGSFSVFRYPVGKPSKMWFPVPGQLIPHAEVNITVEVLPLLPETKRSGTVVPGAISIPTRVEGVAAAPRTAR